MGVAMALKFETINFFFARDNFVPGQGQQQIGPEVAFKDRRVLSAEAVLKSFNIVYEGPTGQHVFQEQIEVSSKIHPNGVHVSASLLLDGSGNIDHPFEGTVDVVVIADVAQ
jgi:hypothetical protein